MFSSHSVNVLYSIPSIILIGGPTASGKTNLALCLAEKLRQHLKVDAEIINADSVQMYKDLKILSAHPSEEELGKVPHHLFGILKATESSSVASWLDLARRKMQHVKANGKIVIFCGGTGLYLKALLEGVADIPEIPQEIRQETWNLFTEIGRDAFFEKLVTLDPESSQKLHKNDTQRVLRAYEVVKYTGKPLTTWWKKCKYDSAMKSGNEDVRTLILLPERKLVCKRAKERVENMMRLGVIEEVKNFNIRNPNYDGPLKKVIGYCEICELLSSNSLKKHEYFIEKIHVRTNQYIKRQSTWFRKQLKGVNLIKNFGDTPEALAEVSQILFMN